MKTTLAFFQLLLCALFVFSAGCSNLAVHVDLYELSPDMKKGIIERANDGLAATAETRVVLDKLFADHRKFFEDQQAILESLEADADALERSGIKPAKLAVDKETAQEQLEDAAAYQGELNGRLDKLEKSLHMAITKANLARQQTDLSKRMDLELEANDLLIAAAALSIDIHRDIDFQFSAPKKGETRPQKLVHFPLDEKTLEAATGAASRLVEGQRSIDEAMAQQEAGISNAKSQSKQIAGKLAPDSTNNPELLADDSDPFLREIEGGARSASRHWKQDFFLQEASASGNSAYLIVRETPTRYVLHRAKSDPSMLIKTQLRLARTGLKIASTVMSATGVPMVGPAAAETDDRTKGQKQIEKALNAAADARAANARFKQLRRLLVDRVSGFEQYASGLQKELDDAVKAEHDAIIALAEDSANTDLANKKTIASAVKVATATAVNERAIAYFETQVKPALSQYAAALAAVYTKNGQVIEQSPDRTDANAGAGDQSQPNGPGVTPPPDDELNQPVNDPLPPGDSEEGKGDGGSDDTGENDAAAEGEETGSDGESAGDTTSRARSN